MQSVEKLYS